MCSILNHLCCNAARHSDVLMLIDFDAPLAHAREIAGVNARGMCPMCVCVYVCVCAGGCRRVELTSHV